MTLSVMIDSIVFFISEMKLFYLRIVMKGFGMRVLDEKIFNNETITALTNSGNLEIGHLANIGIYLKLVANGVNGTVKLQRSNDNVNWTDTGDSLACVNGTAEAYWSKIDECAKHYRLNCSHVANYTIYSVAYGKGF